MKNFKTERERLEKGCGKKRFNREKSYEVGKSRYFICGKNYLCPSCQSALTQLNECEEICREESGFLKILGYIDYMVTGIILIFIIDNYFLSDFYKNLGKEKEI